MLLLVIFSFSRSASSQCTLQLSFTVTDASCNTCADGSVSVNTLPGNAPYTYLWANPALATQTITGLSAGNYCVTVTDSNGCVASGCADVLISTTGCNASFLPVIDTTQANTVFLVELSTGNNLSYLWDFGDNNTSTQQFPTYVYNTFGMFNICLTVSDTLSNCVDSFCIVVDLDSIQKAFFGYTVMVVPDLLLGVNEEHDQTEANIYPNPTSSQAFIQLKGWNKSVSITLHNAIGEMLEHKEVSVGPGNDLVELDLNSYPEGLYFIQIDSGTRTETKRIMKVK
ncbi:MAG: T9SS type A sorting domain-containing protein [Flavobacteriales bacterium]|nr:T9SS type A sorting domain-containing protein [Flavobacteriales bacterium]